MSVENLRKKQEIIDEIKGKLEKAKSAVIVDFMGISVEQADIMRKKLREANVDYTVYKNKMISRAIIGTDYAQLEDSLSGPSAVAISYEDAVAPAKVLSGIMKDFKKMEFKAGIIEGTLYDAEAIKVVAQLPSRDELISKFLGSVMSPVSKLARTLQAVSEQKAAQ